MGLLDRIFRRNKAEPEPSDLDRRFRTAAAEPSVSTEQQATNRDVMESQMADSRAKRDAEEAARDS